MVDGTSYRYVLPESIEGLGLPATTSAKGPVKYLGQAGEYTFLLLPDNVTVAVVRFGGSRTLLLGRFPVR